MVYHRVNVSSWIGRKMLWTVEVNSPPFLDYIVTIRDREAIKRLQQNQRY